MCIAARDVGRWCDPPYEIAGKGSSRSRLFDCPACRNKKKPDPKGGDDGDGGTGAGGSTSTVQTQQSGIAVGA